MVVGLLEQLDQIRVRSRRPRQLRCMRLHHQVLLGHLHRHERGMLVATVQGKQPAGSRGVVGALRGRVGPHAMWRSLL